MVVEPDLWKIKRTEDDDVEKLLVVVWHRKETVAKVCRLTWGELWLLWEVQWQSSAEDHNDSGSDVVVV